VVVKGEKVMITGDDILVEYCDRLMTVLKSISESQVKETWKTQIDNFIGHPIWHTKDAILDTIPRPVLWTRLETRLNEMKQRRKRLVKLMYKKEGRL
jgi:hypothetical protein